MACSLNGVRCPDCPGWATVVDPDGPSNSRIMFIGEAPGFEENNRKRPFIGKTGKEFNDHYLPLAGLHRDNIYITNTVKCYPGKDEKPTEKVIQSCSEFHLRLEMQRLRPQLVVPMGSVAGTLFDYNLDLQHGIPKHGTKWNLDFTLFPMWHPASGLHDTSQMIPLREDFAKLGQLLHGGLDIPEDEFQNPLYSLLEARSEAAGALWGCQYTPMAIDTESVPGGATWCLTFSTAAGSGFMIRGGPALEEFRHFLDTHRGPVVMHYAAHDVAALAKLGIHVEWKRVHDTMVRAWHLGNQPQGLKALAYRLCGMQMRDFYDVVRPYFDQRALDYYMEMAYLEWPKPPEELVTGDGGTLKLYRPQGLGTKVKRLLTDLSKNPSIDLRERWNNWGDGEKKMAEERLGPFPKPSIAEVPFDEALYYACRDADATIRVYEALRQERIGFRQAVKNRVA